MPYGGPTSGAASTSVRNAVINGDMAIAQISPVDTNTLVNLTGFAGTTYANTDQCGLQWGAMTTAVVNDSQRSDHPILGANGFSKSIAVQTAEVAIGANEQVALYCPIEGYIFQPFVNQTAILTFWIKSPKTGTHCVALTNDVDRSYVAEFVVSAANTWQQIIVGLTFNYTGGTWNYTNGLGLKIVFPLAAGANFKTTPYAWNNGVFIATANQQNLLDTIGNTFRVTDVQLMQGIITTAFERIPFDQALLFAQRYYTQTFPYGTAPSATAGLTNAVTFANTNSPFINSTLTNALVPQPPAAISPVIEFPIAMRTTPTLSIYTPTANATNCIENVSARITSSLFNIINVTSTVYQDSFVLIPINTSLNLQTDIALGDIFAVHYTASARL